MTKAALLTLGLAVAIALPATVPAQESSTTIAVNEAVLRQANTIVLRQKLAEARSKEQRGDTVAAAKLYQESCELVQKIGSGIDPEAAQAVSGLTNTRLTLARADQARADYRDADTQVQQVLKVDPKNPAALAFKKQNDQMLGALKGRIPSKEAVEQASQVASQKVEAGTLVQDGKLLYEMGKLDDAEAKLKEAQKMDPDNPAAYYYMNLIQQAKFARESAQHTVDTQTRMAQVEKQWVLPTSKVPLPVPNSYATNSLVYTGPGRQAIIAKLDRIHLDSVSYDGLPLSEVLRNLSEQSKLRDPERKGVNFLINPNPDQSGQAIAAAAGGGFPGAPAAAPAAPAIDPATGLPVAQPAATAEQVDVGSFIVKIPNLSDVRLADVLDAIVLVTDHPVKYSIQDFAVVFSAKGAETPQLFSRTFKVDPNTFYSGLEAVSAQSFGSTTSSGGSGGGGGGGRGGGGGGGSGGQNDNGAVVGVVNAFPGAGGFRSSGSGGGGGGGGSQGGAEANLGGTANGTAAGGGGAGGNNAGGGLRYVTKVLPASEVSAAARAFFTTLGVNLENPPGKSVFFNDRLGKLFVKATEQDLDTIERAIEALNEVAPQVHIKARFIEVSQADSKALGFDWYLGQFNISSGGSVVGSGGSSPSLTTPVSPANPLGTFPGNTTASQIPGSANDQWVTSGLRNSAPSVGTITGILTDPNFRFVIHALEQRSGVEFLAEPEVTTTSGRQTQMRATEIVTVITGVNFEQGSSASTGNTGTTTGQ
jgi:tetratricopeptide (TPR) repeat protein